MRDKLRRFWYRVKHDFLSIENIVLAIAVAMCLLWTYQSIEAMSRNWELTERLNTEQKNLQLLKLEIETAELENEYLSSEEYQELSARRLAGKQSPGEHMVYLEPNSEAAKNKHKSTSPALPEKPSGQDLSNFEQWIQFLFP